MNMQKKARIINRFKGVNKKEPAALIEAIGQRLSRSKSVQEAEKKTAGIILPVVFLLFITLV